MKLRNILLIFSVLALFVVAGCSKPLAGQAINFGGTEYSTEGCVSGEWWYELSDGTMVGEGRGGIVGCTTEYADLDANGNPIPWCATATVSKLGKEVYVSGSGAWKNCEVAQSAGEASSKEGGRGQSEEETGFGGSEPVPCNDSDGGLNYDVKGTLTNPDGETYEDFCSWGDVTSAGAGVKKETSDYVYEYYCIDGQKAGTEIVKCSGGCADGKGSGVCGKNVTASVQSTSSKPVNVTNSSGVALKNVSCSGGTWCDGTSVTGTDGQVVCGTDLQNWKCTAQGWEGQGDTCVCLTKLAPTQFNQTQVNVTNTSSSSGSSSSSSSIGGGYSAYNSSKALNVTNSSNSSKTY